jgi:hypothetical protein
MLPLPALASYAGSVPQNGPGWLYGHPAAGEIRYQKKAISAMMRAVRTRTSAGQADAQQLCYSPVAEADNPEHI